MASVLPWLAVAGLGVLHGLNPATGWLLAAALGVHSRDRGQALRALSPIAVGHVLSIVLVAAAVVFGLSMDRAALQALAGGLFVIVALAYVSKRIRAPAGHAGLALWTFMMSSAHGSGLMLVPVLMPLCAADVVTASDALLPVLAAVGVHTAAMLAVTGVIATGVCRGFDAGVACLGTSALRLHPGDEILERGGEVEARRPA
jgi:hypothetical protein